MSKEYKKSKYFVVNDREMAENIYMITDQEYYQFNNSGIVTYSFVKTWKVVAAYKLITKYRKLILDNEGNKIGVKR